MKRAVSSTLVTALALVGGAGCAGSPHRAGRPTPSASVTASPPPVAVTPDTAATAFRAFTSNYDVARISGDERLGLWWTSEGQSQLTAAAFRTADAAGAPVPRYRYDTPVFYVPKLRPEDTQWFVVSVRRSKADGGDPRTQFMGFIQTKTTQHWRLSLAALLDKKQKPPKVLVGADGYAKALATFDSSLVIPPRLVSSIQATLAEEGPHNVAAQVMAAGPYTTGYYTADQKSTKNTKKSSPVRSSVVYAATSFPIFPLATTDGGGIVLYALSRDVIMSRNKVKPGALPVPADATPFVDPELVRNTLDVTQTLQFVALVPAKPDKGGTDAKTQIIAADGGTVKASVPGH